MDPDNFCCILCYQLMELKTNPNVYQKQRNRNHNQKLLECCYRLLGLEIEKCKFADTDINSSPFCEKCFQTSQELLQMDEKTKNVKAKKELDDYIKTFTDEILQSRLVVLSKTMKSPEHDINKDPLRPNRELLFNEFNHNFDGDGHEIELDIIKEEIDIFEESGFVIEDDEAAEFGNNSNELSLAPKNPSGQELHNYPSKSSSKPEGFQSTSHFPELRILLERLPVDFQKINTKSTNVTLDTLKRGRKSLIHSLRNKTHGRSLAKSKLRNTLGNHDDDDPDFNLNEDLNSDSSESDGNDKYVMKPIVHRRRKNQLNSKRCLNERRKLKNRNERKEIIPRKNNMASSTKFICSVCSMPFKFRGEFNFHQEKTGHLTAPSFECQKCPKKYYRSYDLHIHNKYNHPSGEKRFKCDECSAEFYNNLMLFRHKNGHSKNYTYQCEICHLFLRSKNRFDQHMANHSVVRERTIQCNSCDKSFSGYSKKKNFLAHQIRKHGLQSPFTCKHCRSTFNYGVNLHFHLRSTHRETVEDINDSRKICEFCGKTSKCPVDLAVHTASHINPAEIIKKFRQALGAHKNTEHKQSKRQKRVLPKLKPKIQKKQELFKCVECKSTFPSAPELEIHLKESNHANEHNLKCAKCSKLFHKEIDLEIHRKNCNYPFRTCEHCLKVCVNTSKYYEHVKIHEEGKYKCIVCLSEFTFSKKFQEHINITGHVNVPPIQCPKCSRGKFFRKIDLEAHERRKHELCENTCRHCKKKIKSYLYKFYEHTKSCRKSNFDSQNSQKVSCRRSKFNSQKEKMDVQAKEKKYKCSQCDFKYFKEKSLNIHILRAHSRLNCDLCDRNFRNSKHLIAHQISEHKKKSPFLCKHCKTTFGYNHDLKIHLKSVHGEKQRSREGGQCNFCGIEFKHGLLHHTLSHTDISPTLFKEQAANRIKSKKFVNCNICGIRVGSLKLRDHFRAVHDKKFVCEYCGLRFGRPYNLRRHVGRIHENANPRRSRSSTFVRKKKIDEQKDTVVTDKSIVASVPLPQQTLPTNVSNPGENCVENDLSSRNIIQSHSIEQQENREEAIGFDSELNFLSTNIVEKSSTQVLTPTINLESEKCTQPLPSTDNPELNPEPILQPKESARAANLDKSHENFVRENNLQLNSNETQDFGVTRFVADDYASAVLALTNVADISLYPATELSDNENTFDDNYFEDDSAPYNNSDDNIDLHSPSGKATNDKEHSSIAETVTINENTSFKQLTDIVSKIKLSELPLLVERKILNIAP